MKSGSIRSSSCETLSFPKQKPDEREKRLEELKLEEPIPEVPFCLGTDLASLMTYFLPPSLSSSKTASSTDEIPEKDRNG